MFNYPVKIEQDTETKQYMVEFVDVPAVYSMGETLQDALLNARDALETEIFYSIQDRKPIPSASPVEGRPAVALPVLVSGKVALHNAMIASGTRKADLARRLNIAPSLVDRLLSVRHKTRIEQIETALALFGKRLLVDVD